MMMLIYIYIERVRHTNRCKNPFLPCNRQTELTISIEERMPNPFFACFERYAAYNILIPHQIFKSKA